MATSEYPMFVADHRIEVHGYGHHVVIEADVETHVPPALAGEVLSKGARQVRGDVVELTGDEDPTRRKRPEAETDPAKRVEAIDTTIRAMIAENVSDEFAANGRPKAPAVSKRLGFKVGVDEIDERWNHLRAEAAGSG